LYAYIKDAEKLLEDMDSKRKKERRELTKKYQEEIQSLHKSYQIQLTQLNRKLTLTNIHTSPGRVFQEQSKNEISRVLEELDVKNTMLDEANDQIVCLKSKLHGFRTIIDQLRIVEKKYNKFMNRERTNRGLYHLNIL
jgi:hypothetical protein